MMWSLFKYDIQALWTQTILDLESEMAEHAWRGWNFSEIYSSDTEIYRIFNIFLHF